MIHLPTESDPTNGTRYEVQLDAYGSTKFRCRSHDGLEGAIEQAAEYCSQHLPGILTPWDAFSLEDLVDGQPAEHIYTEYGYLPGWETYGHEL